MNLEHAQMLIDALRDNRSSFSMTDFFHSGDYPPEGLKLGPCQTAQCIGGHAVVLYCLELGISSDELTEMRATKTNVIIRITADYLDIPLDHAGELCLCWGKQHKFIWEHALNGRVMLDMASITVKQAVQAIKNLMVHHTKDQANV